MIEVILSLAVLTFMLWIGYNITGALLATVIWLFVRVPIAFVIAALGILCMITLILIPIGVKLMRVALDVLIPG